MNRLGQEKSPYLRSHASNPVDWYPWGEEAFQKALELDRPIFLSIGYSTCHWCHVMERESFANQEIGKLLNETFINIKVDREEHPEVDNIYMDFAQLLMSGAGGWPLNLVLTPDLKPFLAVTYIPPRPSQGLIGFPELISQVKQLWEGPEKQELILQANKIVESMARTANATGQQLPTLMDLTNGLDKFFEMTDSINGGLKGEPKFPLGFQIEFLLNWSKLKNDSRSLFYAQLTLDMMVRGGLYDHLGGGFSRYAVDEEWTIPHFEKMLYDNAILARTYLQAWKYTQNPSYAKTCREILDYLLTDLMFEQGGFFSGEDADSEGEEGRYYTWTPHEVMKLLPGEEGEIFCTFYDITPQGNFHDRSVLHIDLTLEEYAKAVEMKPTEVEEILEKGRKTLLAERRKRPKPLRDEKILVGWNGLAIDVLARAGATFQEPKYTAAAEQAAQFIEKNLWENGRLLHRWCNGEAKFSALLEDYAFLIKGVLSLFEEGCGVHFFEWATQMTKNLERDFKEVEGAFYQTDGKDPLIMRKCEFYDGAEPSGNAVHTENLIRLYQMTADNSYLRQAEDILKAAKPYIAQVTPAAFYHMMAAFRYLDVSAPTVVIATDTQNSSKDKIHHALSTHFCAHLLTLWKMEKNFPLENDKMPVNQMTTVYICRQNRCDPPLTKLDEIVKSIEKL
jgi:uncharacterized protein YyaL (SSP411 family)